MAPRSDKPSPSDIAATQRYATPPAIPIDASLAPLQDRYEILSVLGSGGMGKVYRARDRETNETVAIKVLRPEIAADPVMAERFKNELRLARRITHKNVCRTYDFNRVGDIAFITMEYLDGESLRAFLRRSAPLAVDAARELILQIGAGLKEAHAQGVVHRDLKPENVMVAGGTIKIMDFGIARSLQAQSTATGAFLGTPAYIAPEQAQGRPVDQRADIYALGLIFYECLTGRAAFSGDTPIEVALKQVNERPLAPRRIVAAVPAHVEAVILRCLEKDPGRRFGSVEQLEQALTTNALSPPRAAVSPPAVARRRRGAVWPWLATAVLLVAGAVLWRQSAPVVTPTIPAAPARVAETPAAVPPPIAERATPQRKLAAAAEAGDPQAQYRLALVLAGGPVTVRDEGKAAQWMHRAAEANHTDAQFALGKMYERGRGVPQDRVAAKQWYERAAAAGHVQARAALERLPPRQRARP